VNDFRAGVRRGAALAAELLEREAEDLSRAAGWSRIGVPPSGDPRAATVAALRRMAEAVRKIDGRPLR
jgi:hypothetical protein